ncbi:MAG: hypothetical protein ACRD0K_14425, partial [Egibacteraceae bacterium]
LDDRWITQDTSPSRHPLPTDTRQYFEHVADSHVQEAIKSHFHPGKIEYFATSAVGFRHGPDGTVDSYDCANVAVDNEGRVRITGDVWPLNVLEPLIWLGRHA